MELHWIPITEISVSDLKNIIQKDRSEPSHLFSWKAITIYFVSLISVYHLQHPEHSFPSEMYIIK